jgi:hypothetical protein
MQWSYEVAQALQFDDRGTTPVQEIQERGNSGGVIGFEPNGGDIDADGEIIQGPEPLPPVEDVAY